MKKTKTFLLAVLSFMLFACVLTLGMTGYAESGGERHYGWEYEKGEVYFSPNDGMLSLKPVRIDTETLYSYPAAYTNLSNNFFEAGVVQRDIDLRQETMLKFYIPSSAPNHVYVPGFENFYMNTLAIEVRSKDSTEDFNTREGADFLYIRIGIVGSGTEIPMMYLSVSFENKNAQWGLSNNMWHTTSMQLRTDAASADYNTIRLAQPGGAGTAVSLYVNDVACDFGPSAWILNQMDFTEADVSVRTYFMDYEPVVDISALNPLTIPGSIASTAGEALSFEVINGGNGLYLTHDGQRLGEDEYALEGNVLVLQESFIGELAYGKNVIYLINANAERQPITVYRTAELKAAELAGEWIAEGSGEAEGSAVSDTGRLKLTNEKTFSAKEQGCVIPFSIAGESADGVVADLKFTDAAGNVYRIRLDGESNDGSVYYNEATEQSVYAGFAFLNQVLRVNVFERGGTAYFSVNGSLARLPKRDFDFGSFRFTAEIVSVAPVDVEVYPSETGMLYMETEAQDGYTAIGGSKITAAEDGIFRFDFQDPRLVGTKMADETSYERIISKQAYDVDEPIVFYMHYSNVNWVGLKVSPLPYATGTLNKESEDFNFTFWSHKAHNGIRTFDPAGTNARWFYSRDMSYYKGFNSLDRFEIIIEDGCIKVTANDTTYTAIDTRLKKSDFPEGKAYLHFSVNAEQYNEEMPVLHLSKVNPFAFRNLNIYNYAIGGGEDLTILLDGLGSECYLTYEGAKLAESDYYIAHTGELSIKSEALERIFGGREKIIGIVLENGEKETLTLRISGNKKASGSGEEYKDVDAEAETGCGGSADGANALLFAVTGAAVAVAIGKRRVK